MNKSDIRESQGASESQEQLGNKPADTSCCDREKCVVEVTNISPKVLEKDVRQLFECCGEIIECELINNESTNRFLPDDSTQTCRLTFATSEAADVAELLSGAMLCGQSVRVQRLHEEPTSHEGSGESEQPTEKQWGYIRRLGQMTGQGYTIGQKAINYLVWFDDKYQISKSLGDKAHQLDERTGLTSSLSSVISTAKDRWHEVEQTHPNVVKAEEMLSSGLSVASEKVSATAEMLKNTSIAEKGSEVISNTAEMLKNTTIVSRGSEVIGEFTSAIQEKIGEGNVGEKDEQQGGEQQLDKDKDDSKDLSKDVSKDSGVSKDIGSSKDLGLQTEGKTQPLQESQGRHSELLGQEGKKVSEL